jgi:type I restriction enzyme S subunit
MNKVRLGDVCQISGTLVDPRVESCRGLYHVGGANILPSTGELHSLLTAQQEELISGKFLFGPDEVLYSKIRPYLRKAALPDFEGLCSADIYPLLPNRELILREFLFFLLLSDDFTDYAVRASNRAGMPKVNRDQLFAYEFHLPHLDEQSRIVARVREMLARRDEIRSLRDQCHIEYKAVFASVLAERFAVFSDAQYCSIEDVTLDSRYGTSRKCVSQDMGTPILRIPNVAQGVVNTEDLKYCLLSEKEQEVIRLRDGDLLIVRTNGSPDLVGRCAVFEPRNRDFGFASYLIRFRIDQTRVLPGFLSFFLQSTEGRDAIAAIRKTSAGQYNVNSENLLAIRFPCPLLELQLEVIQELHRKRTIVNAILNDTPDSREEAAVIQSAILRKAFSGEL